MVLTKTLDGCEMKRECASHKYLSHRSHSGSHSLNTLTKYCSIYTMTKCSANANVDRHQMVYLHLFSMTVTKENSQKYKGLHNPCVQGMKIIQMPCKCCTPQQHVLNKAHKSQSIFFPRIRSTNHLEGQIVILASLHFSRDSP